MTALSDIFTLTIDGASVQWALAEVRGRERVHEPFSFEVTCMPGAQGLTRAGHDALARSILTSPATLTWKVPSGSRSVHAIVDAVDIAEWSWRLRLVPRIAVLEDTTDHQIFMDQDAVQISQKILADHNFTTDVRVTRTLPKREQCVQAFESDLAFVSRLLAEEGIAWFCDPELKDTIVLVDSSSGFQSLPGDPIPEVEEGGMVSAARAYDLRLHKSVTPDKVTLRDFNFQTPSLDLTAEVTAPKASGSLEVYRYRANYTTVSAGKAIAGVHLDAHRGHRTLLRGSTNALHLTVGSTLQVQSSRSAVDGAWIIIELEHQVGDEREEGWDRVYEAHFVAVPASSGYRPPLPPAPTLGGVQHMTVTGPSGGEIHTDPFGRIKAHLRWDRNEKFDDTTSAWLRVANPPTSGGFMLPRVGWEVLTGFWGTSGDVPIQLGRLYNGVSAPPNSLPGDKVVSAFGSLTSPGGGSANLIQTNDTAGSEAMNLNASKDLNESTENDKATNVVANDTHTVGADRTLSVGTVHDVHVTGAQSYSIGASRTLNVGANKAIQTGTETVMIGGLRAFNVGGDSNTQSATLARLVGGSKIEACIEHQSIIVTGASAVVIAGGWTQLAGVAATTGVGGAHKEEVSGAKSIKALSYGLAVSGSYSESYSSRDVTAKGEVQETFAGAFTYDVSGDMSVKGADAIFSATDKITIKADGVTVTISSSEITIEGKLESSQASKDNNDEDYE